MMAEHPPIAAAEAVTLKFLRHPDDEFFDRVEGLMDERWKESELSGDEWRFSKLVRCYSHGVHVATAYGLSLQEAMGRAAVLWRDLIRNGDDDQWTAARTEIDRRCCQPSCEAPWVILYHPVKAYTKSGSELVRPYHDGNDSLGWLDVRGFCEKHKYRGDCALDDAGHNYAEVLIAQEPEVSS